MNAHTPVRRPISLVLASPRGFCAGVDRAIQIVERAVEKFGAPVYVRHEIVHNRYVVDALREKGLVPDDGDAGAEARRRVRRMCEDGGDDAWSLSAQVTAVSKLLLEYM